MTIKWQIEDVDGNVVGEGDTESEAWLEAHVSCLFFLKANYTSREICIMADGTINDVL